MVYELDRVTDVARGKFSRHHLSNVVVRHFGNVKVGKPLGNILDLGFVRLISRAASEGSRPCVPWQLPSPSRPLLSPLASRPASWFRF
jgi:hypothetical protein